MAERISQAVVLNVTNDDPIASRITQLVALSVSGPPNTPSNITQAVVLAIVSNKRGYVSLEAPIKLNCWQPCTSYGINATIIRIGGIDHECC